jgi:5S rRNA maturation endonuclease (ribonuclease M5)
MRASELAVKGEMERGSSGGNGEDDPFDGEDVVVEDVPFPEDNDNDETAGDPGGAASTSFEYSTQPQSAADVGRRPDAAPDWGGISLTEIAGYYHKRLYDNQNALEYLKSRGLIKPELYARFQIGFAPAPSGVEGDGTLLEKISDRQKEELRELGVLRADGKEHFADYLTFPIISDNDQIVGMYGRYVNAPSPAPLSGRGDRGEGTKHLYLKGKHRGVWNRKASKVYDEIILTESIIDALSLIELGFENTQSIYGTNGFTEEHLRILKDDRVKTVALAFDSDEAGRKASESLKERLVNEGFLVRVILPPSKKDWNEELLNGIAADEIKELIEQAEVFKAKDETGFKAEKNSLGYVFTANELIYRVSGVKDMFVGNLRVNVRAELRPGSGAGQGMLQGIGLAGVSPRFYDNLDLYSARSRNTYSQNLSREFNIEQKRIEKDLIKILEYLEAERDRSLSGEKVDVEEMTAEDKALGMELLSDPHLFERVVADMETIGYVGEDMNKLAAWLTAVSRLLPKPLSLFVQSPPSTGKSYLLDTLLHILPPESAEWITSVSDQSFNYMEEGDFQDKIFMLGEALHNEIVEGYIRQMQSENKIARKVTLKDPKTGAMRTTTVRHAVRLVFMMTSTALKVNAENLSRCLVLRTDDSRTQTERVQERMRHKSSYEGTCEAEHLVPRIARTHTAAQRLLKKIKVSNPFGGYMKFPSSRPIMRRGQAQFLTAIDASCTARQIQKQPVEKLNPYTGELERVYECDLYDYGIARRIFVECRLLRHEEDLSEAVIAFYESIRTMAREKAARENLLSPEVTFTQADARAMTDLSPSTVKQYLRILVNYEYLQITSGKRHGTRFCYRLREDKPIEEIDIEKLIPTVEEIKQMMEQENKGDV